MCDMGRGLASGSGGIRLSRVPANYEAAIEGKPPSVSRGPQSGTFAWLTRYRDSAAWASLAPATRRQRDNIFIRVIESAGPEPNSKITQKVIAAGRDRRKDTPFAANDFLKTMRGLFRWAMEAGFVKIDPSENIKIFPGRTSGFHPWTEEEIEKFEARWPIGTREALRRIATAGAFLIYDD